MKKGIIIAIVILILICAVLFISRPDFITGDKNELKTVSIVMNPAYEEKALMITVDDEEEMKRIYDMLDATTGVSAPDRSHTSSVSWDPEFMIQFEYENGEIDEFYSTESLEGIVRTTDSGCFVGKNKVIYDYIENLKNFM